ncbi:MAG: cyclomaltodextrinase, partial [Synergistaceae bacterium]|nr:cyclomaltodextrinase [Synergistaceae bacterium]
MEKWIPHIKNLGCNAVCFSPIFKSITHGYDTTDYFQIDNRLGSNGDFRSLARKFHDEGIRVVLDGVFNHCGRDFFAFVDIREKGPGSVYRDWISGLDFSGGNSAGESFSYDTWSGYDELVKFNLKNPEV